MNSNLEAFLRDARAIAAKRYVNWDVELGEDGVALKGQGWNLTQMANASPPPTDWLNDFGTDARTVEILNSSPPSGPVRMYQKRPLSSHWQNLIKAIAIDQLLVRRNTCGHVVSSVARPLRVIGTCAWTREPWEITVDDVKLAMETARKIQVSGKLADLIFGVVRSILDPNHLLDSGPLSPALQRDKHVHVRTSKFSKAHDEVRETLDERKSADKLPDRRAFWELVRIVFTETPRTFLDSLRFAFIQALILTGLREGECSLLPADWKRYREYFDQLGRPAGEVGGVSRSLMLRHFAEKQRVVYKDSLALFETVQHVPTVFEEILTTTLDKVVAATQPLRNTLMRQIQTGRILPQFEPSELVRAAELYTFLTGNPFALRWPEEARREYVARYERSNDPQLFDELRARQIDGIRRGQEIQLAVCRYFYRLEDVPFRRADGTAADRRMAWSKIYVRVDEVEAALARQLITKQSDTVGLQLANGRELSSWELLFLMPKRALSDVRDDGLCDVTRYCSVGRMDMQMIYQSLTRTQRETMFGLAPIFDTTG